MKKVVHRLSLFSFILLLTHSLYTQTLPPHTMDFKGLWVTDFKDVVLGNTLAENELLEYAMINDFNYLICTNMFQILTTACSPFTTEMVDLQNFIEKAHTVYGIAYISGNVGSDATAAKVQDYNNCSGVTDIQKFDMITYECEFYNSSSNASCPDFTSFFTQLQNIKNICQTTLSSDPAQNLVCEVYIGGAGSTGNVLTNSSMGEMQEIAKVADHVLLTYYRSDPFQSGGNFFNWTITRLEWLASPEGEPNKIVLLLKSRDTDTNNMYDYLSTFSGSHYDALRDPYYSWVEGTVYNSSLTEGYIESYTDGTYPWLEGIQVTGFTWFEHLANLEIYDLVTSTEQIPFVESITIFPNPVSAMLSVSGQEEVKSLELWDLNGQLLKKENGNTIVISKFPNGLYLLKIEVANKASFQKIVIHR